jgi:membrane-bound lytic murein transglycosylase D
MQGICAAKEANMHSRIALPLVLLLFASACAELPESPVHVLDDAARTDTVPAANAPPLPAPLPLARTDTDRPAARAADTPKSPPAEPVAAPIVISQPEPYFPQNSLWTRVTRGFALAPYDNDLVREWENWYANRPDYVARMIERTRHFLFHIVEQVESRGMPMEIALLPMIESAYNPVAYSRSHASGIWQFIPSTGKNYGLRQNWWYDGRRDVIAATDAALDYLHRLYGMFGDWQLALASYNWGEGAVSRAMDRNRARGLPTDYDSLTIPSETRGYIPKLIAVKNIILNPPRYGLQIADIPNEPYFDTVTMKRHIDMKLAAKLAGMPIEEFKFLNPGHNKPVIKAGEAERIVLPRHKVPVFQANLQSHDKPLVSWKAVLLRKGEKAERVAAQHGMTLQELKELNGLQSQKRLVAGQPLLVPLQDGAAADVQLPDLPATPVSLPKAIQAAKAAAHERKFAPTKRTAARLAVRSPVRKGAVQKAPPARVVTRQLRADHGRQVKAVAAPRPSASKKAQAPRVKVAGR